MLSAWSQPISTKRFGTVAFCAKVMVEPAVIIVDAVIVENDTVLAVIVEAVRVLIAMRFVHVVTPTLETAMRELMGACDPSVA